MVRPKLKNKKVWLTLGVRDTISKMQSLPWRGVSSQSSFCQPFLFLHQPYDSLMQLIKMLLSQVCSGCTVMHKNSLFRLTEWRGTDSQISNSSGTKVRVGGEVLFIGPSSGAAHPPLGIGENGRGMGTLALTLKEESERSEFSLCSHSSSEIWGQFTQLALATPSIPRILA